VSEATSATRWPDEDLIVIGRIVRAHGIRGEVKVLPYNSESALLSILTEYYLKNPTGDLVEQRAESVRRSGRFYLVKLRGCENRAQALELVASELLVRRDDLPEAGDGEYYNYDLLGCEVILKSGMSLGVLDDIISTCAHDILSVITAKGEEILLPFNEENVLGIEIDSKRIYVNPAPGLLDVYLQNTDHISRDDRPAAANRRTRKSP